MTVCVGVSVFDGIVFASDSAVSVVGLNPAGEPSVVNVYRNGNKVFNLIRRLPLVAMTCGMANFGNAPIAGLTKDLRVSMANSASPYFVAPDKYTIEEVASKARNFFIEHYSKIDPTPPPPHEFNYWIGGFPSAAGSQEIWTFNVVNGVWSPPTAVVKNDTGIVWGGQPEAIHRLVKGFSPQIAPPLISAGLPAESIQSLFQVIGRETEARLLYPAMPIQDAVELADFLVDTTKRFVRFIPGADTVGGETDIAVVTRHERFKWIKRKHYYPSNLNPMETDHV